MTTPPTPHRPPYTVRTIEEVRVPTYPMHVISLAITYTVLTISVNAKQFDSKYQVVRTFRFETSVLRDTLRNPTKLKTKLQAQAQNHFNMFHNNRTCMLPYYALPASVTVTSVKMTGSNIYHEPVMADEAPDATDAIDAHAPNELHPD